ncbi:hypothetical protein ASPBRDRAFT_200936 [Aspergillus brasiliensis CBS 101740]|uniref:Nephrocystin 3-like N-terminal domain-containing protein n=1 Tax=Aspergillus brasiliensis (strain CBS 101740 / IMI 381727 / IBT 21946) TaxID=767769 RepID=A0A1L9U3S8_ASPBC|nr:hypothetical protein ASPBRDRAFT_200936 [Aspergillus brasiliensis CBS 101740]
MRSDSNPKEELKAILYSDYEVRKNASPIITEGTGKWLLGHSSFEGWRTDETASVLWVTADPGCGKSTLCRSLVDSDWVLSDTRSDQLVCYYFFVSDHNDDRAHMTALCAMLHQVYEKKRTSDLIKHALQTYETARSGLKNSFSKLWKILQTTAAAAGQIICVIDGLDECKPAARSELLNAIANLQSQNEQDDPPFLKFLLTSSRQPSIEKGLQSMFENSSCLHIRGEEAMSSIQSDIDIFIDAKINQLVEQLSRQYGSYQEYKNWGKFMKRKLKGKGPRSYIFPSLVIKDLDSSGHFELDRLRRFADEIPSDLDQAYARILVGIIRPDQQDAMLLFHIVTGRGRAMSLRETKIALGIAHEIKKQSAKLSQSTLRDFDEGAFENELRTISRGFIRTAESMVYLIHATAKDYLIQGDSELDLPSDGTPQPWRHCLNTIKSHELLAEVCIRFLIQDGVAMQIPRFKEVEARVVQATTHHPFLDYAARYWAFHFREASFPRGLAACALQLCQVQSKKIPLWFWINWQKSPSRNSIVYPTEFNMLTVASCLGLTTTVDTFLADGKYNFEPDELGQALLWAADSGHEDTVHLSLENGADVNFKGDAAWTPLTHAAAKGHIDVVRRLSQHMDADAVDAELGEAAFWGHADVVQHLAGIASDKGKNEALGRAARAGSLDALHVLLQCGADIHYQGEPFNVTALGWAVDGGGQLETAKVLVSRSADFNQKDDLGNTPLSDVAEGQHREVLELFLQFGADPSSIGDPESREFALQVQSDMVKAAENTTFRPEDGDDDELNYDDDGDHDGDYREYMSGENDTEEKYDNGGDGGTDDEGSGYGSDDDRNVRTLW